MDDSSIIRTYLNETVAIAASLDADALADMIMILRELRDHGGRLFILGVGGSAANASHAANDFRKIAGIEAYAPADNVAELTARANDDGWHTVFVNWLRVSRLGREDALLVLSVGGGSEHTSRNLVEAMEYAAVVGSNVLSIVSRDGGRAKQLSRVTVLVPVVSADRITPHAEGWQSVLLHLIVNALGGPCTVA